MAEVYSLNRVRRRQQAPAFDMPESLKVFADTFGIILPSTFEFYFLQRSKRGTCVYIKSGPLTVGLSPATGIYPKTFSDARKWMAAIAERQNWTLKEITRRKAYGLDR